jgi:hypothetical protein
MGLVEGIIVFSIGYAVGNPKGAARVLKSVKSAFSSTVRSMRGSR